MSAVTPWWKGGLYNPPSSVPERIKVSAIPRVIAASMTSLRSADSFASVTRIEPLPHADPFHRLFHLLTQGSGALFRAVGRADRLLAKAGVLL